jgi:copper chaperone CopZ
MKFSLFYLALFVFLFLSCKNSENKLSDSNDIADLSVKYEIKITGMTCTGCEQTIQDAVAKLNGITSIKANHSEGIAIIEFDSTLTDTNEIKLSINNTGYSVVGFIPGKKL